MRENRTNKAALPTPVRRSRGAAAGALAAGALLALLSGCGGGAGLGFAILTVGGTAAFGGPVPNAAVLLVDINGKTGSTTTDTTGHYEVSVEGLTPPFLIRVTPTTGAPFFTVAEAPGTANAGPYSNLLLEAFYQIAATSPTDQFGLLTSTTTSGDIPNAVEVAALQDLFERMLASWLQKVNVDPEKWTLLETPFDVSQPGYDDLLDLTSISGTVVTVQDGTATQTSSVTASSTGVVAVDTTVATVQGTTQSHDSTLVAGTPAAQAAIDQLNSGLQQAAATVNQGGTALTDTDVLPFVDSTYLGEGFDQTQQAGRIADFFRGISVEWHLTRIASIDTALATKPIVGDLQITGSVPGGTFRFSLYDTEFLFDGTSKRYRVSGDRRLASVRVRTVRETLFDSATPATNTFLEAVVEAPTTRGVTGATIQPFGAAGATTLTGPTSRQEAYNEKPNQAAPTIVDLDRYEARQVVTGRAPSPTTTYSATVTQGNVTTTYDLLAEGVEGEAITGFTVKDANGTSVGHTVSNAVGETLTLSWTLPQGYDLDRINVFVEISDGSGARETIETTPEPLAATATSATTIGKVPATVPSSSNPVTRIDIVVEFQGRNGQASRVRYVIG